MCLTFPSVSSEMLKISSCMACLSAFKSTESTVHFTFQITLKKKKSGAVETNDPTQPCSSLLCGPEHHLVETTSYGLVGVLGPEIQ